MTHGWLLGYHHQTTRCIVDQRSARRSSILKPAMIASVFIGWILFTAAGCAANSGVVATGPNTYMVSRQAATGFSGMGTLKADALREAGAYCIRQHKSMQLVNATEATPPFVLGNFPKAEIEFKCVDTLPSR